MAPPVIDNHTDRGRRGFTFQKSDPPSYREYGSPQGDPYSDQSF